VSHLPINQLLLSLLRLDQEPSTYQTAIQTLSPADAEALVSLAIDQKVASLVYQALQNLPEGTVPQSVLSPLQVASQKAARFNLALVQELKTILVALNAASIPVIVLKGAYLAQTVYPQLHLRQMRDIDLLIPKDRIIQANKILQSQGYAVSAQYADPFNATAEAKGTQNQGHHLIPLTRGAGLPLVELHWTLCGAHEAYGFLLAEVWQRATPITLWGEPALTLCPEDLLLHLCHHAAYHHTFDLGLRNLIDITRIVANFQDTIDWVALQQTAENWRWQRGVYLTLALTNRLFGLALPDFIQEAIEQTLPQGDFVAQTQTLLLQPKGMNQALTKAVTIKQSYGGWNIPIRIKEVLERIFPPPTAMAEAYPVRGSYLSPRLYRYYGQRLITYLSYRIKAMAGELQALRFFRQTQEYQPAIANHKAYLHRWLKV